ncbi:MAG: helix-turn-helix domain containing protein [Microbacterium sp.]|uniref:TetR/AcrR family transcriptional regulator n=1 Tax=Microbacterium sp. TaxID=51671 RepID=UPI0026223E0D|nr:TetR/AcrR family transcriptional regulator [Microbacterium sp.]MCX6503322.1 helix-turn-helix domain containing protein [Microbacterium sp.]
MKESAEGPRERRRTETVNSLVRAARIATAEHGLHGFTIEELCEQAGVSRRTFFNYFASKEDAILGIPLHRDDTALIEAFLAGGSDGGGISSHLLDDLAALTVARWRSMDIAPDTASELVAAVDREPRLLARILTLTNDGEREDADLVARREHLAPGDVRAEVAAITIGALCRAATSEYLATERAVAFEEIFTRRLDAARSLFATQIARPVEGPL